MQIPPFRLERYFAEYEFKVKYLLSASDCESLSQAELLEMASPASRRLWEDLKLGYTESQGHPFLRSEVASLYQKISPDNVLIAAPEELIYIAMQTLLSEGDHVVAIAPAYQSLHELALSIGCELSLWPVRPGPSGWTLDLKELDRLLTPRTRLLIINFPHNPTGCMISRADQASIVELARARGIILFSDEMYRLLEPDPAARLPAMCDLYEKGISLSGLSKAFSLPGLRLGWLATQDHSLLDRWIAFHDYTTICNSAPSEILGIIALQNKERILQRALGIIRSNLAAADSFFTEHSSHFAWFPPSAGSIAFPRWLGRGSVDGFCQAALNREGVMIVPGHLFGVTEDYFRLGLGRRSLPEALEHLGAILNGL